MARICKGLPDEPCGHIFKPAPNTPDPARCPKHQGYQYLMRKARGRPTGPQRVRPAVRRQVLERDGYACQIRGPGCWGTADTVDHIMPVIDGGSRHDPDNLRAACRRCNSRRGAQLHSEGSR